MITIFQKIVQDCKLVIYKHKPQVKKGSRWTRDKVKGCLPVYCIYISFTLHLKLKKEFFMAVKD